MPEYTLQPDYATPALAAELFTILRTERRDQLLRHYGETWNYNHEGSLPYPMNTIITTRFRGQPLDTVLPQVARLLARPLFEVFLMGPTWIEARPRVMDWLRVKLPETGFTGDLEAALSNYKYANRGWKQGKTVAAYRGRPQNPPTIQNLVCTRVTWSRGDVVAATHIRNIHTLEVR